MSGALERSQTTVNLVDVSKEVTRTLGDFGPLNRKVYFERSPHFSKINSALYTETFAPINVLAQRAYLAANRAISPHREFETYFGSRMRGDIGDYIQARLFSFGVWEPNLSRFVESRIKPDTWAVDIGAHVGYFSLLMARLAPQGHVKAIEASPTTFRQLCEHLELNRAFHVTAINRAVAASPGTVKLYNSKWGAGNTGNNSLIAPPPDAMRPWVNVPSDTLMGTIGGNYAKRVSFIKMDVEGAERPILEEIITNRDRFAERLTVVAEVSDANLDLVERFLSVGFKCSVLENRYDFDAYLSRRTDDPKPWEGKRHWSADFIFER